MIIGRTSDEVNLLIGAIDKLDFITRNWDRKHKYAVHWNLNNTDYALAIHRYGADAGNPYWKITINNNLYKYVKLEKILEMVSADIQTKLLFNLDLFR